MTDGMMGPQGPSVNVPRGHNGPMGFGRPMMGMGMPLMGGPMMRGPMMGPMMGQPMMAPQMMGPPMMTPQMMGLPMSYPMQPGYHQPMLVPGYDAYQQQQQPVYLAPQEGGVYVGGQPSNGPT